MKYTLIITIIIHFFTQIKAQSTQEYLQTNRFDLQAQGFEFPQKQFKILGFGAYHGSANTEKAEMLLLESLSKAGIIKYYLPETDFSIAHFLNKFLKTGDTQLLQDLVKQYGLRVPQERSVEMFQKWQELRKLNQRLDADKKLTVIGIDLIVSYKYVIKHLIELVPTKVTAWTSLGILKEIAQKDTSNYSPYRDTYTKKVLKQFVDEYEAQASKLKPFVQDQFAFHHLLENLKITFQKSKREEVIFKNYTQLMTHYDFQSKPQFARFGVFHLEKSRQYRLPSFFTQLIEQNIHQAAEIISVVAYLTKSKVLWDPVYDSNGNYKSYTTKGGYGIGDYWKEYFKGIKYLKKNALSDLTLFRLNQKESPYRQNSLDLIEVKLFLKKSNKDRLKGKTTTDFIDYALLIRNSPANLPIEELNNS